MSPRNWRARAHVDTNHRDANEGAIVTALEAVGAIVERLSKKGAPDLLVGYRGKTFLLEVKQDGEGLNEGQTLWHHLWRGWPVGVVHNENEALEAIGSTSTVKPAAKLTCGPECDDPSCRCQWKKARRGKSA